MSETPSPLAAKPSPPRLEALEWLASGAHSGMLRIRVARDARPGVAPDAPILVLRAGGDLHRYTSLRDAGSADGSWRVSYVLAAELLSRAREIWLEWPDATRLELPAVETESEYATSEAPVATSPEGEVIDRAVIAERRAQRAESAQRAQARAAADALDGLVALERRLEQLTAENEALSSRAQELESRAQVPSVRLVEAGDESPTRQDPALDEQLEAARSARLAAEREDERQRGALVGVQAALDRVRQQASELRLRLRTQASSAAADSVRAAVLESERASWQVSLATARAESRRVREHLARERRERAIDPRALRAIHARVAGLKGQRDELRVALAVERRARERAEHDASGRVGELAAARDDAHDLRRRLAAADADRVVGAERLRSRVDELSQALEAARDERVAALAAADAARRAERSARTELASSAVARAANERERRGRANVEEARITALQAELSERQAARSSLVAELERARRARRRALSDAQEQREAAARAREHAHELAARVVELTDGMRSESAELETAQGRAEALGAETAQLRASLAALQEKLDRTRSALGAMQEPRSPLRPGPDTGSELQRRIHALEAQPAARDLQARALEQVRAASSVRAPEGGAGRLAAQLDAAAASLRAAVTVEDAPAPVDELDGAGAHAPASLAPAPGVAFRAPAPLAPAVVRRPASVATRTLSMVLRPVARLVSRPHRRARRAVPRSEASLRDVLVRIAQEDSFTAARLLASLLPAQGAFLGSDIDYDVTISELGCFAVTVADGSATVRALRKPRPRRQAELHISADAVTLAELLAGRRRRVGRFLAPVRLRGSRDRLAVLASLGESRATLGEVVRAGARLDPWLVMRALPYAVDPVWTDGHSFTVAQEITGSHPQTWYIEVAGRAGVSVSPIRPLRRPDARVSMPRGTFDRLLAGELPDSGMKPWVWGDFTAVERLRGWVERARV